MMYQMNLKFSLVLIGELGIEHREVRDLLGGDYYVDYADDNFLMVKLD